MMTIGLLLLFLVWESSFGEHYYTFDAPNAATPFLVPNSDHRFLQSSPDCSPTGSRLICTLKSELTGSDGSTTTLRSTLNCAFSYQVVVDWRRAEDCRCSTDIVKEGAVTATCPCSICPARFGLPPISVDCDYPERPPEQDPLIAGTCSSFDCNSACNGTCASGCDTPTPGCEHLCPAPAPTGLPILENNTGTGPTNCTKKGTIQEDDNGRKVVAYQESNSTKCVQYLAGAASYTTACFDQDLNVNAAVVGCAVRLDDKACTACQVCINTDDFSEGFTLDCNNLLPEKTTRTCTPYNDENIQNILVSRSDFTNMQLVFEEKDDECLPTIAHGDLVVYNISVGDSADISCSQVGSKCFFSDEFSLIDVTKGEYKMSWAGDYEWAVVNTTRDALSLYSCSDQATCLVECSADCSCVDEPVGIDCKVVSSPAPAPWDLTFMPSHQQDAPNQLLTVYNISTGDNADISCSQEGAQCFFSSEFSKVNVTTGSYQENMEEENKWTVENAALDTLHLHSCVYDTTCRVQCSQSCNCVDKLVGVDCKMLEPVPAPTSMPHLNQTISPTLPAPSKEPTALPTTRPPTASPTNGTTPVPTALPSLSPTNATTSEPTSQLSISPTNATTTMQPSPASNIFDRPGITVYSGFVSIVLNGMTALMDSRQIFDFVQAAQSFLIRGGDATAIVVFLGQELVEGTRRRNLAAAGLQVKVQVKSRKHEVPDKALVDEIAKDNEGFVTALQTKDSATFKTVGSASAEVEETPSPSFVPPPPTKDPSASDSKDDDDGVDPMLLWIGLALLVLSICMAAFFTIRLRSMLKENTEYNRSGPTMEEHEEFIASSDDRLM